MKFSGQVRQSRHYSCRRSCLPTHGRTHGPRNGPVGKVHGVLVPFGDSRRSRGDTETGQVKVLQLFSVGDTGTAINPRHCEQQLLGAAIMHLGLTLLKK